MVTITIGGESRSYPDQATESWINEQINRRRKDGQNVCVEVRVNTSGLDLRLTTPGCGSGGGGGRLPNPNEQRVIDLWRERGLTAGHFAGGSVIAFLKQLQRQLG
jgi:hypothetical protein